MTHFPSLGEAAHLSDLFRRFPKAVAPLLELHDAFLREPSAFSVAERELMAAYVSGLNACQFCYGAHSLMARAFGVEEAVLQAVLDDVDTAPIAPSLRPVLRLLNQLTREPAKVGKHLADAVLDAGWPEDALYDVIAICALYNYMNRILDGAGIKPGPEYDDPDPGMLKRRKEGTYVLWGREAGLISQKSS